MERDKRAAAFALGLVVLAMPATALPYSFSIIDPPGSTFTFPFGINPQGDIVGNYVAGGVIHGFFVREGSYSAIDVPGSTATFAKSIALSGAWKASTSLSPTQLIYSPAEDIHALGVGGKLFEDEDKAISLEFNLISGESCGVDIRKGRNRNVLVAIKNKDVAERLSSLERPFSVFSPGLAGISKRENYVSDGVLLRTLARGDANLILRNILLRLRNSNSWNGFLNDLQEVFPKVIHPCRVPKDIQNEFGRWPVYVGIYLGQHTCDHCNQASQD